MHSLGTKGAVPVTAFVPYFFLTVCGPHRRTLWVNFSLKIFPCDFHVCISFIPSSRRIQALLTSASSGLEGFKAHAVFQEINKKLHEVREGCLG